jgi:putative membrane protein
MRQALMITLSAAALALGGCGQKTDTTATNTDMTVTSTDNGTSDNMVVENATAPAATAGQMFANTAAASDAFEIATSELAGTNAKSDAIKTFAAKMIQAHTDSTANLKLVATGLSPALTPDPTMTVAQQSKLADLKALHGADFDKAYAAAQVDAHQMALDALKAYAAGGDVPQFKTFASGLVPIVTTHLNMAKDLKG